MNRISLNGEREVWNEAIVPHYFLLDASLVFPLFVDVRLSLPRGLLFERGPFPFELSPAVALPLSRAPCEVALLRFFLGSSSR